MLRQLGWIQRPQTPLHTLSFMSYLIRAKFIITTFKLLNLQSLDIILSTHHVLWDRNRSWFAIWSFQSKWISLHLISLTSTLPLSYHVERNILDFGASYKLWLFPLALFGSRQIERRWCTLLTAHALSRRFWEVARGSEIYVFCPLFPPQMSVYLRARKPFHLTTTSFLYTCSKTTT
jgi:hypothetical protein